MDKFLGSQDTKDYGKKYGFIFPVGQILPNPRREITHLKFLEYLALDSHGVKNVTFDQLFFDEKRDGLLTVHWYWFRTRAIAFVRYYTYSMPDEWTCLAEDSGNCAKAFARFFIIGCDHKNRTEKDDGWSYYYKCPDCGLEWANHYK